MANLVIPVSVQLGNSIKGLSDLYSKFNSIGPVAQKAAGEIQKLETSKGPVSLKTQIREAENEVKRLVQQFGELDPRIEAAAKRAAQLKAVGRDAADAISRFDFETGAKTFARSLGNVAQVTTGVAGAFAFLDDNSKESLKTIKNLQAALSFSQGISALGDLEDSFKNIGQLGKQAFTSIVNGIITATGASKGFAIALASTGVGLLVVGLSLLISKLSSLSDSFEEATEANEALKKSFENQDQFISDVTAKIDLLEKKSLASARIRGASEKELNNIQNQFSADRIKVLENEIEFQKKVVKEARKKGVGVAEAEGQLLKLTKELSKRRGEAEVAQLERTADAVEKQRQKDLEKQKKAAEEAKKLALIQSQRIGFNINLSDLIGEEKNIKRFGGLIEQLQLKLKGIQELKVKAKTFIELTNLVEQENAIQQQIENLSNLKVRPPTITVLAPKVKIEPIKEIPLTEAEKAAKELGDKAGKILSSGIDTSIEDSFASLGEALAAGADPFAALGKTLLSALGNLSISLGKEILTLGAIFKALKESIGNLGAAGKIAVGLALIAFGTAVRAAASKSAKRAGFAGGGYVQGPGTETSDSIPAKLSKGEYVIRARSVRKYGRNFFENLNKGVPEPQKSKALVNRGEDPFVDRSRAIVNARGGYILGPGTSTSDSINALLSNGEFVMKASVVSKYGKDFFDKFNKGIPEPDWSKALVNRAYQDPSKALVNKNQIARFAQGGFFGTPNIDMGGIDLSPQWSKALVNRPLPDTPRVTNQNVELGGDTGGFMPFIAETKISGQDLKIILARADKRYSNVT